jgi:hypothetical protein
MAESNLPQDRAIDGAPQAPGRSRGRAIVFPLVAVTLGALVAALALWIR